MFASIRQHRHCFQKPKQARRNIKLNLLTIGKAKLLLFDKHYYRKQNTWRNRVYWECHAPRENGCRARIVTEPIKKDAENVTAIYTATSRGRMQLIYGGQPFIFEKNLKLSSGLDKKFWRCNQWWNQKCRSRVYTINDIVYPLNRFHTHEEIVKRKKRVSKVHNQHNKSVTRKSNAKREEQCIKSESIESDLNLKYEEIVADVALVMADKTK